jgi:hypothetical protein
VVCSLAQAAAPHKAKTANQALTLVIESARPWRA